MTVQHLSRFIQHCNISINESFTSTGWTTHFMPSQARVKGRAFWLFVSNSKINCFPFSPTIVPSSGMTCDDPNLKYQRSPHPTFTHSSYTKFMTTDMESQATRNYRVVIRCWIVTHHQMLRGNNGIDGMLAMENRKV